MGSWTLGDNSLAGLILGIAILLLIVLVSYVGYEYRRRKRSLGLVDSGDTAENAMSDTNKEIVVYHQGAPITMRLIQTPSGMYCRILDEWQETLLAEKAESVSVIDRVEHLCIGSTDFDRCYESVLSKYTQAESLDGLSFSFSVSTMTGNGGLQTAEPYAEANLVGDGHLIVYSRNRRRAAMLSVEWQFLIGGQHSDKNAEWGPFGRIFDTNGCLKYELKLATDKAKKGHSYALFHAYDKKAPSKSESAFLKVTGKPQMTHWAARQTAMSKTAIVFKVFAKAVDSDRKIQIATIEPAIDGGGNGGYSLTTPGPDNANLRKGSVSVCTVGDQLYSVKFKSNVVDPETKSAILGVAFLLCLRHCMKGLYRTFERLALSK